MGLVARCVMRLRDGFIEQNDYDDLIVPRFWDNLTNAEREIFRKAVHLLPTAPLVDIHNTHSLASLNKPVVRCKARNSNASAAKATKEEADGLDHEVPLAEGAVVMITRNLWTEKGKTVILPNPYTLGEVICNFLGLVNGSRGMVHRILYRETSTPGNDLPEVVLVRVPGYTGPINDAWQDPDFPEEPVVPITPVVARWEGPDGEQNLSRTQLPLTLAWAITIHKSQGLTLTHATIELSDREFSLGLSFVAISRVKSLSGIAFRTAFPISRLINTTGERRHYLREDNARRAAFPPFTINPFAVDMSHYVFTDE